jgi:hypothetical protein
LNPNQKPKTKKGTAMEVSPTQAKGSKAKLRQQIKSLRRRTRSSAKELERRNVEVEILQQEKQQAEEYAMKLQLECEMLKAQSLQAQLATTQTNETLDSFCSENGIRNHSFGARMIALCVNLAKRVSFRMVPDALSMIFDALGRQKK